MSFSRKVKDEVLVSSARHCCVCHRFKGIKIEVHHIIPKEQGGLDTIENAIPLCFDCHSDAGHYYAQHPKGTKFSTSELGKHRDKWFKIVERNQIPLKKENQIHARYLITKEFEVIQEFAKRDLSRFPIQNAVAIENESINLFKSLFSKQTFRRVDIENIVSLGFEDYIHKYPDASTVQAKEGEHRHFYHQRIPSKEDIESHLASDGLSSFLLRNQVPSRKIAKVLTCFEDECAGNGSFEEVFIQRPLYFRFLALTNISGEYLRLKELLSKSLDGILYSESQQGDNKKLAFPPTFLEPNQSVIIPLGMFLSDFDDLEKSLDFTMVNEISGDRSIVLEHVFSGKHQNIEYLGKNYFPSSLTYETSKVICSEEIHEFNFQNIYWIDGFWNCGSCPHLFYRLKTQDLIYKGEILRERPGVSSEISFYIPQNVFGVLIAELEHETSFIKIIERNGVNIIVDKELNKGEQIKIDVSPFDHIRIKGYYLVKSESFKILSVFEKMKLISEFKNMCNREQVLL